jgi:glycosyltransferase involved in cell wall biosynthesis
MRVRFSIIVPAHNRGDLLHEAIESVLAQSFKGYELIVVDDGSTDGSLDFLHSYGDCIRVVRLLTNQGPEVARNAGAGVAQGEYIVFFDSDDFLYPHALELYDRVIERFGSPPFLVGVYSLFADGMPIPAADASTPIEVFRFRDYLSHPVSMAGSYNDGMAIRKDAFNAVGGYRNSTTPATFQSEDLYLKLRLGTQEPCIYVRRPFFAAYRLHERNNIRQLKAHAEGIFRIADAEREGQFPGGSRRRIERYAVIGRRATNWAYYYCWKGGERKLALRILWRTAPMVAAAVWKRLLLGLRKPAVSMLLPSLQLPSDAGGGNGEMRDEKASAEAIS